jgi:Tfp pilus assembly protein PilP
MNKPAVVPAKSTPAVKPAVIPAKTTAAPAKVAAAPTKTAAAKPEVKVLPTKTATPATKATPALAKTQAAAVPAKTSTKPATKIAAAPTSPAKDINTASSEKEVAKNEKPEDKKYSMTGKRDPFISPVVNRSMGSGCSTGKKCLDIEQIALHGVVKSDNGMIAVVTNGLNKAYFLRENDPVFNGYVVKITVDSIVFKQTLQDRLGKSFTKDVVKRILTPAV